MACALETSGKQMTSNVSMKITKMISNNYSMLAIYVVLMIALFIILWFFVKTTWRTLSSYYALKGDVPKKNIENDYNYDEESLEDPSKYMDPGKKRFVAEVDKTYRSYNEAMDANIKSSGRVDNDNMMDKSILFRNHDDYSYETTKY